MSYQTLADAIFPDAKPIEHWLTKYPARPEGQIVTRMAPSPTGFIHTGALYTSLVNQRLAAQSGWVFLLRVEDTDQKREVEGATDLIIQGLKWFDLAIHEGPIGENHEDVGEYGPYTQSQRKEIYHSFAKHLLAQGKAYPCWMSAEKMEKIRDEQMKTKKVPGIYGNYSEWRNKTVEEYMTQFAADPNCVIRFRSHGEVRNKILFDDINRGKINMTDNYNDIVLIKANDRLPTYHLAHIVDDHLMGTTHVIRGEEWLTSVPLHLQLFAAFDMKAPEYCHVPNILKTEDGKKRKLSKRKDPEAGVQYLLEHGYPTQAILDYLLSLIDSSYEEWYNEKVEGNILGDTVSKKYSSEFTIALERMTSSGALFDLQKLQRWSNKYLSKLSNEDLYEAAVSWAKAYDEAAYALLTRDRDLAFAAVSLERHTEQDPKRFDTFADIAGQIDFFYEDVRVEKVERVKMAPKDEGEKEEGVEYLPACMTPEVIEKFVALYSEQLDLSMTKEEWFEQLKAIGAGLGFAMNNKEFKEGGYIGKIGELAMFLRIQICGAKRTPDLCSVMQVLGKERVVERLRSV